jgi:hypothetical protein
MRSFVALPAWAVVLWAATAGAQPAVKRAPPASEPPVVDAAAEKPAVLVRLDGPSGAALMQENAHGWGSVCHAPCLARVARESDYRVLVPGWRPTSSFELSQSPASVKLELAPASELHSVLGQVLGWTGALSLVAGLVTVLVSDSRTGDVVGLSVAGGGALALGIGIPLAISGSHSSVDPVPIARAPTTLVLRGAF